MSYILDFAHWARQFDYEIMPLDQIERVILKASDGHSMADVYFALNYREFNERGISVEAYHYWRDNVDPVIQADSFAAVLRGAEYEAVIVWPDAEKASANVSVKRRQERYLHFERHFKSLMPGIELGTYTRASWWDRFMKLPQDGRPLWVAHYNNQVHRPRLPRGWTTYSRWQKGDRLRLPGFGGSLDWNEELRDVPEPEVQRGIVTASALRVRSGPGVDHPTVDYIQRGHEATIWSIAGGPGSAAGWAQLNPGGSRWAALDWIKVLG